MSIKVYVYEKYLHWIDDVSDQTTKIQISVACSQQTDNSVIAATGPFNLMRGILGHDTDPYTI